MSENTIDLSRDACEEIAADLFTAYDMIDGALAHTLRTSAKLIEAGLGAQIEPRRSQKIMAEMANCTNSILAGRKGLLSAHGLAHRVRMDSSVREEVGCPRFMSDEAPPPVLQIVPKVA